MTRLFAAILLALCLQCAQVQGAAAQGVLQLPALTTPASNEHHPGKVIWADLVTPDLAAAERFYAGLFGWSFRDVPGDPNYALALADGEPIAGIYRKALPTPSAERRQPAWLTFLAARDVDATSKQAVALGGRVLSKPRRFPGRGQQAVLADPEGASFAVLAASGGDPTDYLAAPGSWIWSSVLVTDTARELRFYRTLFGYDAYDLATPGSDETPQRHYVLAADGYARAGLHALPKDAAHRRPHWVNFVRVTDAAAAAQKALSLGGRVLLEPRPDRHGGRLAVLADPAGAPFGVMEWSDSGSEDSGTRAESATP